MILASSYQSTCTDQTPNLCVTLGGEKIEARREDAKKKTLLRLSISAKTCRPASSDATARLAKLFLTLPEVDRHVKLS